MTDKGFAWWEELIGSTIVAIAFAVGAAWATVKLTLNRDRSDITAMQTRIDEHEKLDTQMHEDMMKMIRANARNHEQLMAAFERLHDTVKDMADERKFKQRIEETADAYTRSMLKVLKQHNLTLVRANDVKGSSDEA